LYIFLWWEKMKYFPNLQNENAILPLTTASFPDFPWLSLTKAKKDPFPPDFPWPYKPCFDQTSPKNSCFHIVQLKFTLFDVIWRMVYWCLHYISWLVTKTLLELNGYPECATGVYTYSDICFSWRYWCNIPSTLWKAWKFAVDIFFTL